MVRDGKELEETGRLLDEADKAVMRALLEAEAAVLPSQQARSHPWSPELVIAQRKAALVTKYCKAVLDNKASPPVL